MVENSREALVELAERVEKAEGADREIDCAIRLAVYAPDGATMEQSPFNGAWCIYSGTSYRSGKPALWESNLGRNMDFTRSLDAAKSLLDPKALWAVGSMEEGPFARVCWPMPDGTYLGGYAEGKGATAANSLVAAALRARSADLA